MLLRTDNVLLTQVSRLPSCVSGEGVVLCSGAPMGTRVVAHSVGTASTSDLAGVLGCSGCTRVPNPGPIPLVLGFSLPEFVGNRRRVGVSVAVSVLVTLVVRFGGDELGSGLRVCRQSCRW